MATLRKFAKMTSGGKYHEEQIKYYQEQFLNEAKQEFPQFAHLSDNELLNNKEVIAKLKDNPMAPKWQGRLAEAHGVKDEVVRLEEWRKVCSGYAPKTDLTGEAEKLNNNAFQLEKTTGEDGGIQAKFIEKDGYRMAVEYIFTTSKEFSVLFNLSEGEQQKELIEAYNRSVDKAMNKMEQLTYVRKKENGEITHEKAGGLLWVRFNHPENRGETIEASDDHKKEDKQAKPEPNAHGHVAVINTTKDKDGNNMSLDYDAINRDIPELNREFSMSLTEELRALGYKMKPKYVSDQADSEHMTNEQKGLLCMVPDLPQDLVDIFSNRSKQIKSAGKGNRAREIAQVEGKNEKTAKTNSELQAMWREDAKALNPSYDQAFFKSLKGQAQNQVHIGTLQEYLSQKQWQEKLIHSFYDHHKKIEATEGQVKSYFAMKLHEYTTKENAEYIAEKVFAKHFSHHRPKDSTLDLSILQKKPEEISLVQFEDFQFRANQEIVVIANQRIEDEKEMVENWIRRQEITRFMLPTNIVEEAIAEVEKETGFKLNKRQRQAVFTHTTQKGADAMLSGIAGTGKSTGSAKPIFKAYKKAGFNVIGLGSSSDNTKNLLVETGIEEGYNTEMFLKLYDAGKVKVDDKTVFVWDESAMSDGWTWTRLNKIANEHGASMKFLGEREQLKAVGASTGFGLFESIGHNYAKLTDINRQKLNWQKEATLLLQSGKGDIALTNYYNEGKIITHATADQDKEYAIGDKLVFKESAVLEGAVNNGNVAVSAGDDAIIQSIDEKNNTITIQLQHKTTIHVEVKDNEGNIIFKDGVPKTEARTEIETKRITIKAEQKANIEKQLSIATLQDANRIAVFNYLNTPEKETKLLITDTNENVCALNDAVKEGLKKQGKLGEDLVTITSKKFGERSFAIGDKIVFKQNTAFLENGNRKHRGSKQKKAFDINNGSQGTVLDINQSANTMTVDFGEGIVRTFKTNQDLEVNHSYAVTVNSSQGKSIDKVYFVPTASQMTDLSKFYVALSRQKGDVLLILNDELKSKVEKKLAELEPTKEMIVYAEGLAKEHKLNLEPEVLDSFTKTRDFLNHYGYKIEGKEPPIPHPMEAYKDLLVMVLKEDVKKTTFDFQTVEKNLVELITKGKDTLSNQDLSKLQEAGIKIETIEEIKTRIQQENEQKAQAVNQHREGEVKNLAELNREIPSISIKPKNIVDRTKQFLHEVKNKIQEKAKGMSL